MREVLSEYDKELVKRGHFLGVQPAAGDHCGLLIQHRVELTISPECIVIGARY